MRFLARKSFCIGHPRLCLRVTVNQSGKLTLGMKAWRYSYSFTRKTSTFDTPGPGYVRHQHGRKAGNR